MKENCKINLENLNFWNFHSKIHVVHRWGEIFLEDFK